MDIGRALIVAGILILVVGIALSFGDRIPLLGRLPGDLRFGGDGWTVYAPIGTGVVLSVVLTIALSLFAWLARR